MKIICPNCQLQYAVPNDEIPETGRDVKCAACHYEWQQEPPSSEPVLILKNPIPLHAIKNNASIETPTDKTDITPPLFKSTRNDTIDPETSEPTPKARPNSIDNDLKEFINKEIEFSLHSRQAIATKQPDHLLDPAPPEETPATTVEKHSDTHIISSQDYDTDNITTNTSDTVSSVLNFIPMEDLGDSPPSHKPSEAKKATYNDGDDYVTPAEELYPSSPHSQSEIPIQIENKNTENTFFMGFLFACVLVSFATMLYIFSPYIIQNLPQSETILSSYLTHIDNSRIILQDLYYKGNEPGLANVITNIKALFFN